MITPATRRVVALDLGGTRLKAGVVDAATGEVVAAAVAPSEGLDGPAALDLLRHTVATMQANEAIHAIGVCVPGTVEGGRITALPGKFPGIVGRDIAAAVAADLPVTVVNDAVAYGAGEACFGAGAGHDRVVVMTIGTGVGVCVLEHGRPLGRGPLGGGILGGQVPVGAPDDGPVDTSNRAGTVEARCRAAALVAEAAAHGCAADDVPAIYAQADAGNPAAIAAVDRYRWWLARGVAALCHAHAPSAVVLGGGPMAAGNPVMPGLQALVDEQLWPGYTATLTTAALGDRAAMVGLAHLAGVAA